MKNIYIYLLTSYLLLLTSFSFSQNPLVKQWDARFGGSAVEEFHAFQQTADGGYILGGRSFSGISGDKTQASQGQCDYWVVKTDALGALQWEKRFGGSGAEYFLDAKQTSDGGYILGGFTDSGISGDKSQPSFGQNDYWIVKIDSLGVKQWDKTFGGTANEGFSSLLQTTDGGYLLAGFSGSGISGNKTTPLWDTCSYCGDYWIVKTDSAGTYQWDKDFGGFASDNLRNISQTADGGYLLGGYSFSGICGNKTQASVGECDYWIVKTDSLGNFQWDKDFGGTNKDWLFTVKQTTDAGYILGGISNSGMGGDKTQPYWDTCTTCLYHEDYWIIKTDSLGAKQWDRDFGGFSLEDDFGNISQTADGGYILGGASYSPASGNKSENNLGVEQSWIIKTNALGILQWDKTVFTTGHDEQGLAIQTTDGCYAIANYTDGGIGGDKSQPSQGYSDYWVVKFCDTTLTTASSTQALPEGEGVVITPNPLTDKSQLTFDNPNKEKFLFTLYDITGRVTEGVSTTNNEIILTKGSKPAGVYLFNLTNEKTGERWNGKIVISN